MKPTTTYWVGAWLLVVSSTSMAAPTEDGFYIDDERPPRIRVPPTPPPDRFGEALTALENTVDGYFRAVLVQRVNATDEKLAMLESALIRKASDAFVVGGFNLLTVREMVIQMKVISLRELDSRFSEGQLPADVSAALDNWESTRESAVEGLMSGGEL
jgi:hypothetical protein